MKLKVTSLLILLSVFFLSKIDRNPIAFHAHQSTHSFLQLNNDPAQTPSYAKLTAGDHQHYYQAEEEDEESDDTCVVDIFRQVFSLLNTSFSTHYTGDPIVSFLGKQSSRIYVLYSVFRI